MIDKSGQWWKGDGSDDLKEFLVAFCAQNYGADDIRLSKCQSCDGTRFGLIVDDEEGCARRVCRSCGFAAFIADSAEYWDDASPGEAVCPCAGEDFEIAVGFSLTESGEVRWITVGARCAECGVLGGYVDWKVDYEPSRHLIELA